MPQDMEKFTEMIRDAIVEIKVSVATIQTRLDALTYKSDASDTLVTDLRLQFIEIKTQLEKLVSLERQIKQLAPNIALETVCRDVKENQARLKEIENKISAQEGASNHDRYLLGIGLALPGVIGLIITLVQLFA